MIPVPIQAVIPKIKKALETFRRAVVDAPPGAGKTTRVPLALLDEPWLAKKKIILLEPRRLAAISCAGHMADLLKETVGQTVGYQIRMDRQTGPKTRIEVITEGIFTRKIQQDPFLEDVGLVIFDEFHERNIHSDLGLALCLETVEALREDLRLLVMSATMDVSAISGLMDNAPVISSRGKSYPVTTTYLSLTSNRRKPVPIEHTCALTVQTALLETDGDLLVFLPGVREIKTTHALLVENLEARVQIVPLYGNLSRQEQAAAFYPSKAGHRKIVLATAIAETSITIDGIFVVIDSGLMRVPMFSPVTGMTRLETIAVSKASADQRRGRAGRTAPGKCYRLWTRYDHGLLKPFSMPDILSVDLAGVALELAAWGVSDPGRLKWVDLPETNRFAQARDLLFSLGALDENGHITGHGKKMVSAGLHPRLSHMVIKGIEKGHGFLGCRLAAFLNERDFMRFDPSQYDPDIELRLDLIEAINQKKKIREKGFRINKGIIHRILASEINLAHRFGLRKTVLNSEAAGELLAHAYPDRIAQKRDNRDNSFLLASGKGAYFQTTTAVAMHEYIVALHLDGNPRNAKIFLAVPYSRKALEQDFGQVFKAVQQVCWDQKTGSVKAEKDLVFDSLVIESTPLPKIDPDMACDILIREIQRTGLQMLIWPKKLIQFKDRAVFLKNTGRFPELPDVSDKLLEAQAAIWLKPFLTGVMSVKQLEKFDLTTAFMSLFTWEDRQTIEKMAPSHIIVPSGSGKPLRYSSENILLDSPVLEVRLQEMFGLCSTPAIAGGTIPVTLHLLSPAGRPVQITKDLNSFWRNTYKEVKKDLMGRYPKHFWPDDPLLAVPTNRAKPRGV